MEDREYTVSIYTTRLPFPLWHWVHTYVVCSDGETQERFEVIGQFTTGNPCAVNGYILKNLFPVDTGFYILPGLPTFGFGPCWRVKIHSTASGSRGSSAHKLYSLVTTGDFSDYPYATHYNILLGPNSNTLVQWVIDQVPECNLELPSNAWGKNYSK